MPSRLQKCECHDHNSIRESSIITFIDYYYFAMNSSISVPTALSLDGQFSIIGPNDRVVDHFVREIEQHDYLLEDSPTVEQLRKYVDIQFSQS